MGAVDAKLAEARLRSAMQCEHGSNHSPGPTHAVHVRILSAGREVKDEDVVDLERWAGVSREPDRHENQDSEQAAGDKQDVDSMVVAWFDAIVSVL